MAVVRRGGVLAILLLALVPSFAVTSMAARLYHLRERTLAVEWTTHGDAALAAGQAAEAVDAYQTALGFARDDRALRLALARALEAAHQSVEARAQLLALRDVDPTSGVVNLELARLAASNASFAEASSYYHAAVTGTWDVDADARRRLARLEFADLLLQHGDRTNAQAQLIALSADLPARSSLRPRVARLLLDAGAANRALDLYRQLVDEQPHDPAALEGAGDAAFELADYATARAYLREAAREQPLEATARERLETATAILELNPFERRLSSSERSRRAFLAFRDARARLADCARQAGVDLGAQGPADSLRDLNASADALEPSLRQPAFARDSDLLDTVMTVVFRIETVTAARCGAPTGVDRALLLLAREERASDR